MEVSETYFINCLLLLERELRAELNKLRFQHSKRDCHCYILSLKGVSILAQDLGPLIRVLNLANSMVCLNIKPFTQDLNDSGVSSLREYSIAAIKHAVFIL